MRCYCLAVFTLTAILAGGLTAQADESPNSQGSTLETNIPDHSVDSPTATFLQPESIATIEALEEKFLSQNSEPAPSLSPQITEVMAVSQQKDEDRLSSFIANQREEFTKPISQTSVAENPKAEVINDSNTLTELPKAQANLPESQVSPLTAISQAEALNPEQLQPQTSAANINQIIADVQPETNVTCAFQQGENPESVNNSEGYQIAQAGVTRRCPRPQPITPLVIPEPFEEFGASPALSIYIPVGYGADRNTVFLNGNYQATVREDDGSVGAAALGIGVGDADKAVGFELSYALETTDDDFGEGGFNAKLHRRLGQDLSAALGWNGFLNIGRNDFEQSKYGVITKVFRTQESLNQFFSRVAVTVGVGDGQFRSNGAVDDGDNNINVFGNVAIRVVRPVSFIAEWTGQDLGLGLSIAPFKNFPFVITPAVRDIAGAGDEARFVIGAGTAIRF